MADPFKFLSGIGQNHLLKSIGILFNHDEEMMRFFFSHKQPVLRLPARCLVEEATCFKQSDQILIRIALDYWNRRGYAKFGDMLNEWSHEEWIRFLHSVVTLQECDADLIDVLRPPSTKRGPGAKK